jgi:hypothetical protein
VERINSSFSGGPRQNYMAQFLWRGHSNQFNDASCIFRQFDRLLGALGDCYRFFCPNLFQEIFLRRKSKPHRPVSGRPDGWEFGGQGGT